MTTVEKLRVLAPEFKTLSDDEIDLWMELAKPYVSEKQFGKLYPQALAYMTAHLMKLSSLGEDSYGSVADALKLSSVSEGNTSISFNTGAYNTEKPDADLGLTQYGVLFKKLRSLCVFPAVISGGNYG